MPEEARYRTAELQTRLEEAGIDVALLTDEASIAYYAGFWGYLALEFGRPTFLVVTPGNAPVVITPLMESEMVAAMTWVENIETWEDAGARRWENVLDAVLKRAPEQRIAVETSVLPSVVRNWFDHTRPGVPLHDVSPLISEMRMIKSPSEIDTMRQAGEIAQSMMQAAHQALYAGAREYEASLAVMQAGSRKAASLLNDSGRDRYISPVIHGLPIVQSGADTSMVHRRANTRVLETGDPVYFCFCNLAEFKHYRLGFDRMFFIDSASDEAAKVQIAATDAQQAAIAAIKPGVTAESIADAANVVYRERGFETGYRTGRSIGMAYLESPELKAGDTTVLQVGMTFAVDGGISVDGQTGGRIGDSIVVTETGCEYLTQYPRELLIAS